MDLSNTFFIQYFFLILTSLIMLANSVLRYRQHPRISVYTAIIIFACLILAGAKALEHYGKVSFNIPLTTICSFIGYCLKPFCLFFFIMMSDLAKNKKLVVVLLIPLIINTLIYSMMFIPPLKHYVVYFANGEEELTFQTGGALRFSSHIISAVYLFYLAFISFSKISNNHIWHGLTLIVCLLFVVLAVVIESFFNDSDKIDVLSTTIAFSTVVYYLFLYLERTQFDGLTGLLNRETYYRDIVRMEKSMTAIVQFDINGLKYINDTYGHLEGDKAISFIASLINQSIKRNMYVYRLGGDEFTLVAVNTREDQILEVVEEFKKRIAGTEYNCSIGYAIRESRQQTVESLFKKAEQNMYKHKAEFYKSSPYERRKF